jgi:hypothetical protein
MVDTGGRLHPKDVAGDPLGIVNREVGPEGFGMVRFRGSDYYLQLCGFVNDCGLELPVHYPRNVIGSCLLAALGANQQPYAGPVVITGWNDRSGVEVCDLPDDLVATIQELHVHIRVALGYLSTPVQIPSDWSAAMVEFAAFVSDSPAPEVQIISDPAALRGN